MTSALNQFEVRLLKTEQRIRENAPFAEVFQCAVAAIHEIEPVPGCAAWASVGAGPVRLAAAGTCSEDASNYVAAVASLLTEPETRALPARKILDGAAGGVLITPVRLTDEYFAALEIRTKSDEPPEALLREGAAAVTDCLADVFRNAMLEDFQLRLQNSNGLLTLCHRLYQCKDRESVSITLATEIRALLDVDRASVLWNQEGLWELAAASGVDTVDATNPVCKAIVRSANSVSLPGASDTWIATDQSGRPLTPDDAEALRTLSLTGTSLLRVLPLNGDGVSITAPACLVLELFQTTTKPADQSLSLVRHQLSPLIDHWSTPRTSLLRRIGVGRTALLVALAVFGTVLLAIPTDFEIEVTGQLFPADRYRVFSPDDGTIEEVNVANEAAVAAGDEMVHVRNPDLDLQLQQTAGNLETERVRLTAIQRTRSVSPVSSRMGSLDQILAGETAVAQRVSDLQQRMELLSDQRDSLTVTAQTNGTVYRANLKEELLSRPVQRGEFLFEVIPGGSAWHLELYVPDDVVGYVQKARLEDDRALPVRFYLRMAPGTSWQTQLDSLDNSVEILDGKLICRGTADVDEIETSQLRPGTSVTARIFCGRRLLGFVVFREMIEFAREQAFAWF